MDRPLIFKTECQTERERRDLAIYNEYQQLVALPGQSKTSVMEHLMKNYNIHSVGTIYVILRRVEERQKQAEEVEA
jgi:Mor family transcriptional regulator